MNLYLHKVFKESDEVGIVAEGYWTPLTDVELLNSKLQYLQKYLAAKCGPRFIEWPIIFTRCIDIVTPA